MRDGSAGAGPSRCCRGGGVRNSRPGSGPSLWRCAESWLSCAPRSAPSYAAPPDGEDYNHGRGLDSTALIPEARHPNPAFTARREYWLSLLASEVGGPSRLLDIGCGAGALLDVAKREGWDGIGQEISSVAAAEARAHSHHVVVGELSPELFPTLVDAATMIEVVEHIPDPRPTLTAARALIRGGGALLLTTGDIGSTRARLQRRRWGYIRPPIRVSYFTRKTMEQLLLTCGFSDVTFPPKRSTWHFAADPSVLRADHSSDERRGRSVASHARRCASSHGCDPPATATAPHRRPGRTRPGLHSMVRRGSDERIRFAYLQKSPSGHANACLRALSATGRAELFVTMPPTLEDSPHEVEAVEWIDRAYPLASLGRDDGLIPALRDFQPDVR